jgi:ATP-dependent helicase/nuclease subunit B
VAKIEHAGAPVLPEGVTRVVVLGVADPVPLALRTLEAVARTLPVDIVVFAPEGEAAAFDAWGRPLAETWAKRELVFAEFERRVQLCADPAAQAERIVAVAQGYGEPEGMLAVGVADAEVLPLLETGLRHAGLEAFDPGARARRGDGLHQLLAALAGLAREDSFAAVATLARCPDFLEFLRGRAEGNFSAATFLAGLDQLQVAHLPPDLREARRHRPQSAELAAIADLRATLTAGRFPENAAAALATLFAGRDFDLVRPADALAAAAAEAWSDVTRELAAVTDKFRDVTNADWWDLALRLYGQTTRFEEKPVGAVELQGWLELLWEDAPHLVVAGLNDGRVPDAVVGDPFLPETLRERLGLKTNAARFARDAYLLQALAACRAQGGRLDLLLGKTSVTGDPLRPSRLLLRCADAELPRRVEFLFGAADSARANPPWRRAWRLQPERGAAPAKVAVTALRAWLECPFRFYLSRVLKMQAIDPAKTELDEQDFGILCHAALEAMGRADALRDCTDAKTIREFLLAALDAEAAKRFGRELTLPLLVQLESARQRLSRLAEVQAQTRAEGWVIERVETEFAIEVGGLNVRGKIDRIDRHEGTGAIRVLDYKTSDKPVHPVEAHLRLVRRDETAPEFARVVEGDREHVWRDLQLPLGGYTPWLAESAWRCAEDVAAAIRAGQFWPPNEHVRAEYDDFASLFHGGVAESVAWEEAGR